MSASLGALVLEIAARQLIPVLVTEVSAQAFRHAARTATEAVTRRQEAEAPPPTLHTVRTATVISEMPGRVRLQISGLRGDGQRAAALQARLEKLPGVSRAEASALTGRALVQYDPARTTLPRILAAAESPAPVCARRRAPRATPLALVAN
ncbi:MAG TPA: hypothetical protein VII06_34950 [Chloroflexota bacterium]